MSNGIGKGELMSVGENGKCHHLTVFGGVVPGASLTVRVRTLSPVGASDLLSYTPMERE